MPILTTLLFFAFVSWRIFICFLAVSFSVRWRGIGWIMAVCIDDAFQSWYFFCQCIIFRRQFFDLFVPFLFSYLFIFWLFTLLQAHFFLKSSSYLSPRFSNLFIFYRVTGGIIIIFIDLIFSPLFISLFHSYSYFSSSFMIATSKAAAAAIIPSIWSLPFGFYPFHSPFTSSAIAITRLNAARIISPIFFHLTFSSVL